MSEKTNAAPFTLTQMFKDELVGLMRGEAVLLPKDVKIPEPDYLYFNPKGGLDLEVRIEGPIGGRPMLILQPQGADDPALRSSFILPEWFTFDQLLFLTAYRADDLIAKIHAQMCGWRGIDFGDAEERLRLWGIVREEEAEETPADEAEAQPEEGSVDEQE